MKNLTIEWQHLDIEKGGVASTCVRCADTGEAVADVVEALARECAPKGVEITCRETKLPASEVARSNLILFNGRPIEEILPRATASESNCPSCCELVGEQTNCRTVEIGGRSYEALPADLIRQAACAVAQCCDYSMETSS